MRSSLQSLLTGGQLPAWLYRRWTPKLWKGALKSELDVPVDRSEELPHPDNRLFPNLLLLLALAGALFMLFVALYKAREPGLLLLLGPSGMALFILGLILWRFGNRSRITATGFENDNLFFGAKRLISFDEIESYRIYRLSPKLEDLTLVMQRHSTGDCLNLEPRERFICHPDCRARLAAKLEELVPRGLDEAL